MTINLTITPEQVTRLVERHLRETVFSESADVHATHVYGQPNSTAMTEPGIPNFELMVSVNIKDK